MITTSSTFKDSKAHFLILDALRGVAAIVVVLFHIMEVYSHGDPVKQVINHGYLAVDFFFMLSGYVMAHAYDDRWDKMTVWDFFKRRLIRLHPMILCGMTVGAVFFYFAQSSIFPNIATTPVWMVIVVMLIAYTMIPLPVSMDIRGWSETYPLNGPAWSLSFEYVANILHALVLRRMSKPVLAFFVALAAVALVHLAVASPQGDIIGGWSLTLEQLNIGFTRLLFPYMAGMLLRRVITLTGREARRPFLLCSVLLVAVLAFPRVGGHSHLWEDGVYECAVIILVFPVIVYLGAIGRVKSLFGRKVCTFLGDISYPLYITHYPFIYLYSAWVVRNDVPFGRGLFAGLGILAFATALAYAALKLYDEPVRRWLAKRYLRTGSRRTPQAVAEQ